MKPFIIVQIPPDQSSDQFFDVLFTQLFQLLSGVVNVEFFLQLCSIMKHGSSFLDVWKCSLDLFAYLFKRN